jgi:hypothetical protein
MADAGPSGWFDCAGRPMRAPTREDAAQAAGVPVSDVRDPFRTLDRLLSDREMRRLVRRAGGVASP